jgi:FlaA1/EpsC-like NDP-sugar epimerase
MSLKQVSPYFGIGEDLLQLYRNKRILVTGGAGAIGSNLVRALLASEPEHVIVIDDLSSFF